MKKLVLTFVFLMVATASFGNYIIPSVQSAAFPGWFTNNFSKAGDLDQQGMALQIFGDIIKSKSENKITTNDISNIEKILLTKLTQDWWDKNMKYPVCKYSFQKGIVISDVHGIPKIKAMYEKALNSTGRTAAIKLYKKYNRRPTISEMTTEFSDLVFAMEYLNTELYYDVNTAASQIVLHAFKIKHDQLIEAGYPVWRTMKGGRTTGYSDGANELLRYTESIMKAFNEPYFFGIDSKLQEIGVNAKFNPKNVISPSEAVELSRNILFESVKIDNLNSWMLRVTIGVDGINELIDRKINGDKQLMEKTGNNPSNVKKNK